MAASQSPAFHLFLLSLAIKFIRQIRRIRLMANTFLKQKGNYRSLVAYQKSECIYDITYYFAHKFLEKGDRTIDQMIQAARSGKQNIAITLIHQEDVFLRKLPDRLQSDFVENGGIKEQMSMARIAYHDANSREAYK